MAAEQKLETPEVPARIVVLGDSLAAGYGLSPSESFPALLQQEIEKRNWPFLIVNAGVSGDTSADGLRRLDSVLRSKADVLLLALGSNDGLRGIAPETTRANLQKIIDRTREKYPAAQLVVAGLRMPASKGAEFIKRFEKIFPELASQNNALLIPYLLDGVGSRPEMNLPDGIHPTREGHVMIAATVWKILGPLLERMLAEKSPP